MGLPGDQFPKGMEIPMPESVIKREPLNLAEENYVGKIRGALVSIPGLQIEILECVTFEKYDEDPVVQMRFEVKRKEGQA